MANKNNKTKREKGWDDREWKESPILTFPLSHCHQRPTYVLRSFYEIKIRVRRKLMKAYPYPDYVRTGSYNWKWTNCKKIQTKTVCLQLLLLSMLGFFPVFSCRMSGSGCYARCGVRVEFGSAERRPGAPPFYCVAFLGLGWFCPSVTTGTYDGRSLSSGAGTHSTLRLCVLCVLFF